MHQHDRFWRSLVGIGGITLGLGLVQLIFPASALGLLGEGFHDFSRSLALLSGTAYCIVGVMLLSALRSETPRHIVVLWSGLFKLCMAVLIGMGAGHVFTSWYALALVMFELCAGAMIIAYWFWLKQQEAEFFANSD